MEGWGARLHERNLNRNYGISFSSFPPSQPLLLSCSAGGARKYNEEQGAGGDETSTDVYVFVARAELRLSSFATSGPPVNVAD